MVVTRRCFTSAAVGLGLACSLAFLLGNPRRAEAYAEDVHQQLALVALKSSALSDVAAPANLVAAGAVRTAIDAYARSSATLRSAWIHRYPDPGDFDDWAFKQFLLFEPSAKVYGIDRLDERVLPTSRLLDMIALATRHPDEDWRNRDRIAYDAKRVALKSPSGGPVPADPALLNMGKLGTLSSQAHAHYGLAQVEFSEEADTLKSDPRRFARKAGYERAPIITLAAEMAQEHLDIALIAALSDAPGSRELSWSYTGAGFHYTEDVGNQIHTVQVGLYEFFVDAFKERLFLGLLTGGGYLGQMRSLASIGIDILSNHHVLSEHLTMERLLAAVKGKGDADGQALLSAPAEEDPEFSAKLDEALRPLGPNPERGEFALILTRTLIEVSSHEGDAVYRATRAIADPILRTRRGVYDDAKDHPDKFLRVRDAGTESAYRDFFSLQIRAFRRVGTVLRRWVALQQKAMAADTPELRTSIRSAALERLITRQLRMLDEQDARLTDYLQHPPELGSAPEHSPGLLAVDFGLLAIALLLLGLIIRRVRRSAK